MVVSSAPSRLTAVMVTVTGVNQLVLSKTIVFVDSVICDAL
jgi:hypothetical protein